MMDNLPYCYFPSKIVCIDDSQDALNIIKMAVDKKIASYEFFHNPMQALNYLSKKDKPAILFDRVLGTSGYPLDEKIIYELYQEIYNSQRYDVISCVIVDYAMPGMTGLELCNQIKDPSIKKILLTGIAEEELVIEAFNKGLIDFYIRKHDPKAYDLLEKYIYESQCKYFKSLTEIHINAVLKNWITFDKDITALFDPMFIEYFKSFIKENNIIEYYLRDLNGSFVCLNTKGKISSLYVFNESSFEENEEEVKEAINSSPNLSNDAVKDLKHRRKTICFPFDYDTSFFKSSNLDKYIYPLQTLEGQRRYYIAHATEVDYLEQDKILNFSQYKKSGPST